MDDITPEEVIDSPTSPLEMSDEDFMNAPAPTMAEEPETELEDEAAQSEEDESTAEEETAAEEQGDGSNDESDASEEEEAGEEADVDDTSSDTGAEDVSGSDTSEVDTEGEDVEGDEDTPAFVPISFRANNKDMQVDNIEDARKLMSMGANYNKKMAALKPNLRIMKMLENNKLLDENKLSYLIDLDKKDPAAITKLIKESGLDPLDVDVTADSSYRPNTYTVDDKEVELDAILEDIQGTNGYQETIDIVSNKWDESSKRILLTDPTIIRTLNEHVESGVYSQVWEAVERERMLGRLDGVSDIEAYKHMGYVMREAGQFRSQAEVKQAPAKVASKPTAKKIDPKLNDRKKAASGTKSTPSAKKTQDFNPLEVSDEEFEKISSKFI